MAIGWWSKRVELSAEDKQRLDRKCVMIYSGLQACLKANKQDPGACNRLDTRCAECYAEDLCPAETEDFQKCYHKAGTFAERDPGDMRGQLKERGLSCDAEAAVMKRCLQKYKVYPFNPDAAPKKKKQQTQ